MKLVVLLGLGVDVRVPPERDPRSGRVREEWLVREIDAASDAALGLALRLKAARADTEATVVQLGPPGHERWLRQALARGCDRAVRIWDDEAATVGTAGKAVILAAAVKALGFDLALAGSAGVVDAGRRLGVLVAEHLGVACATQAVDVTLVDGVETAEITRGLDRGYRERVEVLLPALMTVSPGAAASPGAPPAYIPVAALLAAHDRTIPVWDLADLGVPFDQVRRADRSLEYGPLRPRRPRMHPLTPPDQSLPAFERVLKLIQGSVQRREGRIVRQPPDGIVDEVFKTLRDEGWLDHLRPEAGGKP
ncbi:MAG: hypothetical protein A2133_05340 [Actinobacteria bacterium RBG_16_64_13]|nr:MAG: hypothetical protein A2133_05340 [Actinobacteria bacterium RBG_16_64_13]